MLKTTAQELGAMPVPVKVPNWALKALRGRRRQTEIALHGLSQDELSEAKGLRAATISRLERGGDPAPSTVRILSEFFEVPGTFLLGLDVPEAKEQHEATEGAKATTV